MRVLLCPIEIAGYMGRINTGLNELGIKSKFFDFSDTNFGYYGATNNVIIKLYKRINYLLKLYPNYIEKILAIPLRLTVKTIFFIYSLIWANVIIFCFSQTFFGGWELPFYKLIKKKIIFIYLGSDSRPLFLNGSTASKDRGISLQQCYKRTRKQRNRINWYDYFADVIIDHPPSGLFHKRPFIPFLCLGMPTPNDIPKVEDPAISDKTVILHAPSFPECKGTEQIRSMIFRAKQKYRIEYVELIGRTNNEVLTELKKANFVIDEMYSDSVLAGLGTEAAFCGKATLVGGYGKLTDLGVNEELVPPAYKVLPEEMETTLIHMLETPEEVANKGQLALNYVVENWGYIAIAQKLLNLINNNFENIVLFDPNTIQMSMGWGFSKEKLQSFLSQYINAYGAHGLFLDDKPCLRDSIIKFAKGTSDDT